MLLGIRFRFIKESFTTPPVSAGLRRNSPQSGSGCRFPASRRERTAGSKSSGHGRRRGWCRGNPGAPLQHLPGVDVQMVGRLIQNQRIHIPVHQLGKPQAHPLASAQIPHLAEDGVTVEEETGEDLTGRSRIRKGTSSRNASNTVMSGSPSHPCWERYPALTDGPTYTSPRPARSHPSGGGEGWIFPPRFFPPPPPFRRILPPGLPPSGPAPGRNACKCLRAGTRSPRSALGRRSSGPFFSAPKPAALASPSA